MLAIVQRILELFKPFWKALALISALIMLQRAGDLLVPLFGGRVIDAMAQHRPLDAIYLMVGTAFVFWICHGNILPYVLGRVDLACFQYAGPRHLGVGILRHLLRSRRDPASHDTAMQQAVIERGEVVVVQFVNSLFRVVIPLVVPGIVTLGLLLWWYPLIGVIVVIGGVLDILATIYLNRVLKPLYTRLQELDYERQRWHTHAFRHFLSIVVEGKQRATGEEYDQRFGTFADFGTHTGRRFLRFNFGRGLIINVTNLCTWGVGAWYVDAGTFSLGYFLASLSWSTYVLNVVGSGIEVQKQWMETMPAIKAFFAEVDAAGPLGDAEGSAPAVVTPIPAGMVPALGAE